MSMQSLRGAVEVLALLASSGCQVRVEGDALHVHDPKRPSPMNCDRLSTRTSWRF